MPERVPALAPDPRMAGSARATPADHARSRLDSGRDAASENAIHQSLLAGLLSHIGLREGEKRDYLGARGSHFAIFPGSGLFKKPPRWVMAAELVETSRLWARMSARIEPEWAESSPRTW
ncbi:hypothetical protein GCM10020255_076700 [Rhodococcus baikonurensis]